MVSLESDVKLSVAFLFLGARINYRYTILRICFIFCTHVGDIIKLYMFFSMVIKLMVETRPIGATSIVL